MPKKGKHDTPEELDYLFDRDIISEDMYRDFWNSWWRSSPSEREEMIQFYSGEEEDEEEQSGGGTKLKVGIPTKFKSEAERQAKKMGGYVVRRNAKGQFSKRGKTYQAIKRREK
jgi:hypothetical protein